MVQFNELLQVALGQREKLTQTPTKEEWTLLYSTSVKQAMAGIVFASLEKLSKYGQKPPQMLLYEWIGFTEQVKLINQQHYKYCIQLQKNLAEKGLRSSILKGQGVALYYDEPLRNLRQSGDIDVYVDCGRKKAVKFFEEEKIKVVSSDYKHAQFNTGEDLIVELHYHVEVLLNLRKNIRLQKWFRNHEELLFEDKGGMTMPTIEFNVFYILLHIYRHFLYEGVGLRQIMDYYFVLKQIRNKNVDLKCYNDSIKAIRDFGMEQFAKGLMWLMKYVFMMPEEWMIFEADEKEGIYILSQVMEGGNFGSYDAKLQHDEGKWGTVKSVCKHNWYLMRHYPDDVFWAPIWFVWHKCWKLTHCF